METNLDRAVRRARPLIFVVAALSLPAFLLTYGYALKLLFQTAPAWVSVVAFISHVTAAIGASCLADEQKERQLSQGNSQHKPPAPL